MANAGPPPVEVLAGSQSPPTPDTTAPQVSVSDPKPGMTVSGIVVFGATASDNVAVKSVQFKVDGQAVGAPVTAPPFQTQLGLAHRQRRTAHGHRRAL